MSMFWSDSKDEAQQSADALPLAKGRGATENERLPVLAVDLLDQGLQEISLRLRFKAAERTGHLVKAEGPAAGAADSAAELELFKDKLVDRAPVRCGKNRPHSRSGKSSLGSLGKDPRDKSLSLLPESRMGPLIKCRLKGAFPSFW